MLSQSSLGSEPLWGILPRSPQDVQSSPGRVNLCRGFCPDLPRMPSQSSPGSEPLWGIWPFLARRYSLAWESEPLRGILPRSPQDAFTVFPGSEPLWKILPRSPQDIQSSPGRVNLFGGFCADLPRMPSQSSPGSEPLWRILPRSPQDV